MTKAWTNARPLVATAVVFWGFSTAACGEVASSSLYVRGRNLIVLGTVALLKWNSLPGSPVGGTAGTGGAGCNVNVTAATIRLYVLNSSIESFNLYPANRSWVSSQATWTNATSTQTWQVSGARGSLDRGASIQSFTPSALGTLILTLGSSGRALVGSWLMNPASNHGIVIGHSSHVDEFRIASFDHADVSKRPMLIYDYECIP
jgi:hypothetical protein